MGRKSKLKKFAELSTFPNVFQNFNPRNPKLVGNGNLEIDLKGAWNLSCFQNDHPIVLELACGKAEYSLGLASQLPNFNFIGVDIKGSRIWKGAKTALDNNLTNVAFLRTGIEQLKLFFDRAEVFEIWLPFPDPYLRKSKANKRLTSPRFLKTYRNILKKGGLVHLKTDSSELYTYTIDVLMQDKESKILYANPSIYDRKLLLSELAIKTYYEKIHISDCKSIKYLRFIL